MPSSKETIIQALRRPHSEYMTTADLAKLTGATGLHATAHLLYSLQKQGLLTFKEKGTGTGNKTLYAFELTRAGKRWRPKEKK